MLDKLKSFFLAPDTDIADVVRKMPGIGIGDDPTIVPYSDYKDDPRMIDYGDPSRVMKIPVTPPPATVLKDGRARWLCLYCGTPNVKQVDQEEQYSLTCIECGAPASPIQVEKDTPVLHYEKGEPFPTGFASTHMSDVMSTETYVPGMEYQTWVVRSQLKQAERLAAYSKPRVPKKPTHWRV